MGGAAGEQKRLGKGTGLWASQWSASSFAQRRGDDDGRARQQ
jgi:hypothetical protein